MRNWKHRLTQKDLINKTAICSMCGFVSIKIRGKKQSIQCRNAYNACRRGVSLDLIPKPKICPICLCNKKLVLDHKHGSRVMRGWICQRCNSLIGWLKEDSKFLKRMVDYIESFSENPI